VVLLHNVPPTATPSDIYRLLPSFSRHIASITFFRLPDVQFAGRVAVSFARTSTKTGKEGEESEEERGEREKREEGAMKKEIVRAKEFAAAVRKLKMSGRQLRASMVSARQCVHEGLEAAKPACRSDAPFLPADRAPHP
jgi:hypothetical protein